MVLSSPNIKDVSCSNCGDVDIIAGLVEEHLEITDDSIGSLPALSHSTWFGDLDPTLTGRTNTMVDVNTKGKLSCERERERERERENVRSTISSLYMYNMLHVLICENQTLMQVCIYMDYIHGNKQI